MNARNHGYGDTQGWVHAYESLTFTVEALGADPDDAELVRLATRLGALLSDWEAIDADRRRLRHGVVRANARARVADASLDRSLGAFAADLLAEVGNDTRSELYTRFFMEPHEDIIAMGLDSEVPLVTLLVHALADEGGSPAKLRAHRDALLAALRLGNRAIAERSDALADLGRHGARIQAWREGAASATQSVHRSLHRLAGERKLPMSWVHAFFPAPPRDAQHHHHHAHDGHAVAT